LPLGEGSLGQLGHGHREVLPSAKRIDEFHIHHFRPLLAGRLYHALGIAYKIFSGACYVI
jgi:hypothetical protein